LRKDVRDVKTTLERVTLSLEEEARSFIAWRLKEALGVEVALDKVFVDTLEINVYGVTGDLCVVGEATVRLGLGLVEELLEKVEVLKRRRPELLRRRMLKVIYTDVATPQALQGPAIGQGEGYLGSQMGQKLDAHKGRGSSGLMRAEGLVF
jgi:hypothetical protein